MAETALITASQVQKWDAAFLAEYVRDSRFRPYMGNAAGKGVKNANPMMPIMVKTELTNVGRNINIPLITRLKGAGKQGNDALIGQEEPLGNYNQAVFAHWNRNAVSLPEADEHWTEMDLRHAAKMMLQTWAAESLRDDIICALLAYDDTSFIAGRDAANLATFARRTPADVWADQMSDQSGMDAWLEDNVDRVLFGPDPLHTESDFDFSDSVVKLTDGADAMSAETLIAAKNMAKFADPHIRPIRVNNDKGREYYVCFMSSADFGNAKRDPQIYAANKDARSRGVDDHPLFQDGDMIYDGIILREIPEIPSAGGIGAGPADIVSMSFLCGAQALSVAWAMRPQSRKAKEDDYGHFTRLGITEARGVAKNFFVPDQNAKKQHGVVSIFSTAAPNT